MENRREENRREENRQEGNRLCEHGMLVRWESKQRRGRGIPVQSSETG